MLHNAIILEVVTIATARPVVTGATHADCRYKGVSPPESSHSTLSHIIVLTYLKITAIITSALYHPLTLTDFTEISYVARTASNRLQSPSKNGYKVKVKWLARILARLHRARNSSTLLQVGNINAMVMKQKSKKGTAMIDYKTKQGADMAVQFEKGQIGKPVEVSHVSEKPPKESASKSKEPEPKAKGFDFESVADMNRRREEERKRLIEEILRSENM
nr:uncharacterized protein LOC113819072 [Penaeus vannamei]